MPYRPIPLHFQRFTDKSKKISQGDEDDDYHQNATINLRQKVYYVEGKATATRLGSRVIYFFPIFLSTRNISILTVVTLRRSTGRVTFAQDLT